MTPLGHVATRCDGVRESFTLEDDHLVGEVRQGASGEQSRHAPADHDDASVMLDRHDSRLDVAVARRVGV